MNTQRAIGKKVYIREVIFTPRGRFFAIFNVKKWVSRHVCGVIFCCLCSRLSIEVLVVEIEPVENKLWKITSLRKFESKIFFGFFFTFSDQYLEIDAKSYIPMYKIITSKLVELSKKVFKVVYCFVENWLIAGQISKTWHQKTQFRCFWPNISSYRGLAYRQSVTVLEPCYRRTNHNN